MKHERLYWILGLVGAVGAAVGITALASAKASAAPTPNKPPVPTAKWVPVDVPVAGKKNRVSAGLGGGIDPAVVQTFLKNLPGVGQSIFPPGSTLPADWPADDTDKTRWRAEFVPPTPMLRPPGLDLKFWTYQLGA